MFLAPENGWYTTVVDNQIIDFTSISSTVGVNSIIIEAFDVPLAIKINDNTNYWYIDANKQEGIDGLALTKIQVMKPAGTKIRWKALVY